VTIIGYLYFENLQGMTNNVRFIFSVGDTTWAVYKLVLNKANRMGEIKHNN